MKDESVQKLDFSDEFMLESVEKRFQDGNYLGALKLLNKRNKMYGPSADAQALAADIYEAMGLWQQAASTAPTPCTAAARLSLSLPKTACKA